MQMAEQQGARQGLSYLRMMDNAGSVAAKQIMKRFSSLETGAVAILCGTGNNGGDGFVVARRLAEKGVAVSVILINGYPESVSAMEMAERLKGLLVKVVDWQTEGSFARRLISESLLVVDGVFGTGFHGDLPAAAREVFGLCAQLEKPLVALDMPSGVCADTGTVADGTPRCVLTVTFHAYKYAHVLYPAVDYCGEIVVEDIGLPASEESLPFVIDRNFAKEWLQRPEGDTHKGTFGKAVLFVGNKGMAGAAQFAVRACLRCGVGLALPVVSDSVYPPVSSAAPEGVYRVYPDDCQPSSVVPLCMDGTALLAGCGSGNTGFTRDVCYELVNSYAGPLVLDADGINSLAKHIDVLEKRKGPTVLTPHPAELARLLKTDVNTVQANRFAMAKKAADQFGAVTVLKGAGTVIVSPDGRVGVNLTGNSGLSKGGSGDVLAGMIVSLIAQGVPSFEAACVGVWLHGTAADLCASRYSKRAMLPSDLIETLPLLFSQFEE